MTTHLESATSKQTATSEIRELIAAMPIVIFANAIRDALKRPQQQQAQRRGATTVQRAIAR